MGKLQIAWRATAAALPTTYGSAIRGLCAPRRTPPSSGCLSPSSFLSAARRTRVFDQGHALTMGRFVRATWACAIGIQRIAGIYAVSLKGCVTLPFDDQGALASEAWVPLPSLARRSL